MKKINFILFGLLILILAACNPSGDEETENILPTLVPTAVNIQESSSTSADAAASVAVTVVEEAAEIVEEVAETTANQLEESDESTLINLDNILLYNEPPNIDYLTTLEYYMTVQNDDGSTSQVGRIDAQGARTVTPDASSMLFNIDGGAGGGDLGETMNIVQIESTFYALMAPNECIALAAENAFDNPFDLFLDAGDSLSGNVQRVLPNQAINGIDSRHYVLDEPNFTDLTFYDEVYTADLYVAEEGGYVTRLLITGYGINEVVSGNSIQEGDIYYELNNIPTANIPTITPPAGCSFDNAIASEYPTLPDATGILSNEGLYAYETETSFDEVVQFYKTEMTKNNEWALTQEVVDPPNALLTFTGSGSTVIIGIGPGQNGGTQVGIIPTP